jgi:hypothetical protein
MNSIAPLLLASVTACTIAAPTTFTIDPTQSSVEVELCVNLFVPNCDTDSSPAVGTVILDLAPAGDPTSATILDFDAQTTEEIATAVSFGFLGSVFATTSDLALTYAGPLAGTGPFVIDPSGDFTVVDLTLQSDGMVQYEVTGAACSSIAPQPCSGMEDFGTAPPETLSPFVATLTSDGETYTLRIDVTIEDDLLPSNPGVVLTTVTGTLVATAPVLASCIGDADGDGVININDLLAVLGEFGSPPVLDTDFNDNGIVDIDDLLAVLGTFGTACP